MSLLPTALVLCAGLGSRLRPLTLVRAKPAIPVAGEPLIRRIIRWLAANDIRDVVVNLHYLPESIGAVLGDGSDLGVRARYSWEYPAVLGSAGGPRQALDIIGRDTFLIVNGDTLTDLEPSQLMAAHAGSTALATLAVIPNREPDRYSGLRVDGDGDVVGVVPRGSSEPSFHFIGVQMAHASAFASVARGQAANSIGEVYNALIAERPGSIRAFPCDARFLDIGRVSDYWTTSHLLAGDEHMATAPRASVDAPAVAAARGATVGSGVLIEDSIVWDDVTFEDGARLRRCIVTDGVRVPRGSAYEGQILLRGTGALPIAVPFSPEPA